jgi:hypothetical protein
MLKPVPKVEDFENKYQKGGKRILEEDKKKPQGGERIHEEENQTKAEEEIVINDTTWAAWFYRSGVWVVNAIAETLTIHFMNKGCSWLFTKLTGMTRENWANVAPVVFGVMSGTTGAWTVSTPDTTVVGLVWVVVSGVSWKLSDVFLRYILQAPAPAGNPVGAGAALPVVAQPVRAGCSCGIVRSPAAHDLTGSGRALLMHYRSRYPSRVPHARIACPVPPARIACPVADCAQ